MYRLRLPVARVLQTPQPRRPGRPTRPRSALHPRRRLIRAVSEPTGRARCIDVMRRTLTALLIVTLGLLSASTGVAHAGGWAVVALDPLPASPVEGQAMSV